MIQNKFEEIKIKSGNNVTYLGMLLQNDYGNISISMKEYIMTILDEYPVTNLRTLANPTQEDLFHSDIGTGLQINAVNQQLFHRITARLLYLTKRARPDIALTVNH